MSRLHHGKGLYGLSKSHIVCQTAAKVVLRQKAHPIIACLLIGPQSAFKVLAYFIFIDLLKTLELLKLSIHGHLSKLAILQILDQCEMMLFYSVLLLLLGNKCKKFGVITYPRIWNNRYLTIW